MTLNTEAEFPKLSKFYDNITLIGGGGMSSVYSAVKKTTKESVAIKVMNLNTKERKKHFNNEIKMLQKFNNSNNNVVDLIKAMKMKTKGESFGILVQERMDFDFLSFIHYKKSFSEKQAKKIFYRICKSVYYCHVQGIAHLDLKPDNILLQFVKVNNKKKVIVKLCDFGFAKQWNVRQPHTSVIKYSGEKIGTTHYLPPEILLHFNKISYEKTDVWSLGVILFSMITGYFPFNYEDGIMTSRLDLKFIKNFTTGDGCYNLLVKLLEEDFNIRPNLFAILNHSWFRE